MSLALSVYLDLVRFLAAVAVFVHHVASTPITEGSVWWPLRHYGDIAVTVFFVLSGYVIAHVVATRERTAAQYASARLARFYSVAIIALALTWVFDYIGMTFHPEFYHHQKVLWEPPNATGYVASAFFVNEFQIFGFDGISPGSNGPYWSMSFEAAYYAIGGLLLFARREIGVVVAVVLLAMAGQTVAAMFPIWVIGFALYRVEGKWIMSKGKAVALAIFSVLMLAVLPYFEEAVLNVPHGIRFPWGRGPFERDLPMDYLAALACAMNLIAAQNLAQYVSSVGEKLTRAARAVGDITFPLYCLHFPSICFFAAFSPWSRRSLQHLAFVCASALAVAVIATPVAGLLKVRLRRFFLQCFDRQAPAST